MVASSGRPPSCNPTAIPYAFAPRPGSTSSLALTDTVPVCADIVPMSTLPLTMTVRVRASKISIFVSGAFVSCAQTVPATSDPPTITKRTTLIPRIALTPSRPLNSNSGSAPSRRVSPAVALDPQGLRFFGAGFINPRTRVRISLAGLGAADLDAVLTGCEQHVIPQEDVVLGVDRSLADAVDLQLHRFAVGVNLHRRFGFGAVGKAPAGDVNEWGRRPVGFVPEERVLFHLAVVSDQSLVITAR